MQKKIVVKSETGDENVFLAPQAHNGRRYVNMLNVLVSMGINLRKARKMLSGKTQHTASNLLIPKNLRGLGGDTAPYVPINSVQKFMEENFPEYQISEVDVVIQPKNLASMERTVGDVFASATRYGEVSRNRIASWTAATSVKVRLINHITDEVRTCKLSVQTRAGDLGPLVETFDALGVSHKGSARVCVNYAIQSGILVEGNHFVINPEDGIRLTPMGLNAVLKGATIKRYMGGFVPQQVHPGV